MSQIRKYTRNIIKKAFSISILGTISCSSSVNEINKNPIETKKDQVKEVLFDSHLKLDLTGLNEKESLGKIVFNDKNLSEPKGQSCASCHDPAFGYATPTNDILDGMSKGANPTLFGKRNAPSIMYLANAPEFHMEINEETKEMDYLGGSFLDGSALDLKDQVFGPLLSRFEMNNPNKESVVSKIKNSQYVDKFKAVYGDKSLDNLENAIKNIQDVILSYEKSKDLNKFTSKYDFYVKGQVNLTEQEKRGFDLFKNEKKANCAACHVLSEDETKEPSIFTDFSYDNLGVPKNNKSPFLKMPKEINPDGDKFIDRGLGDNPLVKEEKEKHFGRFRTPTLRNIDLTAPYMHNGVFKTLEDVVKFYNTTCEPDNPDKWDPAEIEENRNCEEIGKLKLTKEEINDIVSFLKTLTDGYIVDSKN